MIKKASMLLKGERTKRGIVEEVVVSPSATHVKYKCGTKDVFRANKTVNVLDR